MNLSTLKPSTLAGTVITAGVLAFSSAALAIPGPGGGSDPTSAYASAGPQATVSEREDSGCTVYRPRNVEPGTPVILWGNGTGGSPTTYGRGLEHWASYGYIVAAARTSNAGTGEEMIECIDAVRRASYGNNVDFSRIGASGHSQGGGGTIMAARDVRITATAPMQPYILGLGHRRSSQDEQSAPMLLLSGSSDALAGPALNQRPVFNRVDVPVFWATRSGASHFEPIGNFGDFRGISTAWWEFQLKGDSDAAELFTGACTACDISGWDVQRKGL
ncbi:alpha/beta hydrolase [uncultured Marinobacter sp.]|uniref:poly(ethylene terephthalate) hydrolase family protein n=1 Tax=uncultured Marinobacter sp. TaxID=187379 RepID=UPI0030D77A1F